MSSYRRQLAFSQLGFKFFVGVGDLSGKQRQITAKDNMRRETHSRLRFIVTEKILDQRLESYLALGMRALVHGRQHFAKLNKRHQLLEEIGRDDLNLSQKI